MRVFGINETIETYFANKEIAESHEFIESPTSHLQKTYSKEEREQRGDTYLEMGFAELAQNEYQSWIEISPKNPTAYIKLAHTLSLAKNYKGAIENLKKSERLSHSDTTLLALAKNYIKNFDYTSAQTQLSRIATDIPEADYYLQVITLLEIEEIDGDTTIASPKYLKSKKLDKAFKTFNIAQDADNIYLKTLIANALKENGDYQLSISFLNIVLNERPDYRDAWIVYGYNHIKTEKYKKAKEAFSHAYDLDSTKPETQFFLAFSLEESGERKKALEFYRLAYKNQYKPKIHVIQKIAELSMEFEQYDEALQLYEEFLKIEIDSVDRFIKPIWIALEKIEDKEKAKKLALWARENFPNEAQSYNLLAWVALEENKLNEAQKLLQQSFQIDPNFPAAHLNQARIYEKAKQTSHALSSYETAYKNDKDGPIGKIAAEKYNEILKNLNK